MSVSEIPPATPSSPGFLQHAHNFWARVEDWLVALALAAMMLLPLLEIVLRQMGTAIPGSASILQHLVLLIAMLGSVVAAREQRLLALSTFTAYLKGNWSDIAKTFASSIALAVTIMFCIGGALWVRQTMDPERMLFPGFPEWWARLLVPIGFGLLAIRLLKTAGGKGMYPIAGVWAVGFWAVRSLIAIFADWPGLSASSIASIAGPLVVLFLALLAFIWLLQRTDDIWRKLAPLVIATGLYLFGSYEFDNPGAFVWPLIVLLLAATVAGTPIYVILGGAALIGFWGALQYYPDETVQIVALNHYDLVKSPMLVTLPLFTLAGYLLAQGNSSQRLIRLIEAIFGGVRGSAAVITVLVCAFFTTFTGASGVTILALGGLLLPVLKNSGYTDRDSIGLMTGAGSLGVLFPPCLPLILYAIVASTQRVSISLEQIFLGGVLPGALLLLLTIAWGVWKQPPGAVEKKPFVGKELVSAIWGAMGELLLPVVALVSLFSGYATPVEAASVSAFYAFILYLIDALKVRKVSVVKELPDVMAECGLLVGGVLLILGVAMGFTNYLITEMVPTKIVDWAQAAIESPLLFLLLLNVFLILVGCLMDIFSAIIVVVPLIVPLGAAYGINPVHLGIIFLANLQLGYITPPIGMNLFLASYRFDKPMSVVIRAALPMLAVFIVGVLLITYVPALTTWLPSLLDR